MKYLQDLGADLEGLDALAAHEIVQAPAMGELTRKEFVEGWSGVKYILIQPCCQKGRLIRHSCDSLEKQKQYLKNVKTSLSSSLEIFTKVYTHTFQLAKGSGNQKAVPLEMATEYWNLLFTHQLSAVKWSTRSFPWAQWWTEFLTTEWKRSINKDIWNQTLKFAQLTLQDEAMSFWSEEASWPSVIDEFVEWVKKEKRGITGEEEADGGVNVAQPLPLHLPHALLAGHDRHFGPRRPRLQPR